MIVYRPQPCSTSSCPHSVLPLSRLRHKFILDVETASTVSDYEESLGSTELNDEPAKQAEDERGNACYPCLLPKVTAHGRSPSGGPF